MKKKDLLIPVAMLALGAGIGFWTRDRQAPAANVDARGDLATAATRVEAPVADAATDACGAQVAALDLDGGQETPGAHVHRKRDRHVEHGGGKATLDIAEVIAEGGLWCEGDPHQAAVLFCVQDLKRRELKTDGLRG